MNSANQQRNNLRPQLFRAEAKNTPGKKLDEEEWLVPNWEEYIKLHFELPDPGAPKAVEELRKMVDTHWAPDYKGGKKGGDAKPIPPRRLGDLEFAKLEELLPIYEEKLQAWWEAKNAGQVGQVLVAEIEEEGAKSREATKTAERNIIGAVVEVKRLVQKSILNEKNTEPDIVKFLSTDNGCHVKNERGYCVYAPQLDIHADAQR